MSELCQETSLNPKLSQIFYKLSKKVAIAISANYLPKSSAKNMTMFGGFDLVPANNLENIMSSNESHVRAMVMFIFSQYFDRHIYYVRS